MYYHPDANSCLLEILEWMEWNGVYMDKEMRQQIFNIFGESSMAGKRARSALYWHSKMKLIHPFVDVRECKPSRLWLFEREFRRIVSYMNIGFVASSAHPRIGQGSGRVRSKADVPRSGQQNLRTFG